MKHFYLPALISLLPLAAAGVPAFPGPVEVMQPDGTTITIRMHGDEHFGWCTDANGTALLEYIPQQGWTPVVRHGRMLRPVASDLDLLRSLQGPSPLHRATQRRLQPLDNDGRTKYPTLGQSRALVVLMEFSDVKFTVPDARNEIDRKLNQPGYHNYGMAGSARDYFLQSSGGQFDVHFDVSHIVTLKEKSSWYNGLGTALSGAGRYARIGEAIQEALTWLDDEGMDFAQYDLDSDGRLDNVYLMFAGVGQNDSGSVTALYPHKGYYTSWENGETVFPLTLDGVRVDNYACSAELGGKPPVGQSQPWLDGIGTFCHEYSHVLGLPDLYDIAFPDDTRSPGRYSILDTGVYNGSSNGTCPPLYSAYERWVCHWEEPLDAEEGTRYTLPSNSTGNGFNTLRFRIRKPTGYDEYYDEWYMIESRSQHCWDTALPDHGMLVWHINYDPAKWQMNEVNFDGVAHVELAQSDGVSEVWPGPSNVRWSYPESDNFLMPWNFNRRYEIFLTGLDFDPATGEAHLDYNVEFDEPDFAPVMAPQPTAVDKASKSLTLQWTLPEGARYALLTVRNRQHPDQYVQGLNELNLGNVDSWTLSGLSAAEWDTELEAWVRAAGQLPSTEISQVITFRPSELAGTAPDGRLYPRTTVVEEGTATTCSWCVRGTVGLHDMYERYPGNFIGIALHRDSDPMDFDNNYAPLKSHFAAIPRCVVNRQYEDDPATATLDAYVRDDMARQAPAQVKIRDLYFNTRTRVSFTCETETEFGADTEGDYRLAFVLLEDGMGPWPQANSYHDNSHGEMGGWENQPLYVMTTYDHVAHEIYDSLHGVEGSLPQTFDAEIPVAHSFSHELPATVADNKNLSVAVLLLDNTDHHIVNADLAPLANVGSGVESPVNYALPSVDRQAMTLTAAETMAVFTPAGICIGVTTASRPLQLPGRGLYIVKAGNRTFKIAI